MRRILTSSIITIAAIAVLVPILAWAATITVSLAPGDTADITCSTSIGINTINPQHVLANCHTVVPTATSLPSATLVPTSTPVPPTATSVPPTATVVPPTPTMVMPTATPTPPPGGTVSQEFGSWHPNQLYDTCTEAEHNNYFAMGADGKKYSSWHPPTHTNGCTFGHEHGADPVTSVADNTPPAFGYAAEQMNMVEPHTGFKVFVVSQGTIVHRGTDGQFVPAPADARIVFHMGTGGVGRYSQQFHSLEYDYIARDGSGREFHIYGMANTGDTVDNGSTCDFPRKGAKDFSTLGCNDPYEIWNNVNFTIHDPTDPCCGPGQSMLYVGGSTAVNDPITTRDPADNSRLVFSQNVYRPSSGIDPTSPQAHFRGCNRDDYVGPHYWNVFDQFRQNGTIWTDAFGDVQPGPGPNRIQQYVSPPPAQNDPTFFLLAQVDHCHSGTHTPN